MTFSQYTTQQTQQVNNVSRIYVDVDTTLF